MIEHGIARRLLDKRVRWCGAHEIDEVFLGTTARFLAAHRFYEKNCFRAIGRKALARSFPIMTVDTRFYRMTIRQDAC